jgi:hypothetical protein
MQKRSIILRPRPIVQANVKGKYSHSKGTTFPKQRGVFNAYHIGREEGSAYATTEVSWKGTTHNA